MPSPSKNGASAGSEPVFSYSLGQRARRDLARFDVGLVERVDADASRRRSRVAISQRKNSSARSYLVGDADASRRACRPAPARRPRRPASASGASSRRRYTNTRSSPYTDRGAATVSRSTGMMPLPLLPVDSAIELLEPRAEVVDARRRDERQLVHALMRRQRRASCRATRPGLSAAGTPGAQAWSMRSAPSSSVRRRGPSPPPAPCRSSTAPSSGRRCSSPRERCARKPSALASCSRFDPGSVTAMKWLAARVRADGPRGAIEEIRLEDVRFERRARLARDDEQRAARGRCVASSGLNLRRVRRVEHVQFRRARRPCRTSPSTPPGTGSIRPCRAAARA